MTLHWASGLPILTFTCTATQPVCSHAMLGTLVHFSIFHGMLVTQQVCTVSLDSGERE